MQHKILVANVTKRVDHNTIHEVLDSMFSRAIEYGIVQENPTAHIMDDIKKKRERAGMCYALTPDQTNSFISFTLKNSQYRHWFPLFVFLFGTGCRLSEILGLRWNDFDLENNRICIGHAVVLRYMNNGKSEYHVVRMPERKIPMIGLVRDIITDERYGLKRNDDRRRKIDGMNGFVFRNKAGNFYNSTVINRTLKRVCQAHNENEAVHSGKKEPLIIPYFSCQHVRNTYWKYIAK